MASSSTWLSRHRKVSLLPRWQYDCPSRIPVPCIPTLSNKVCVPWVNRLVSPFRHLRRRSVTQIPDRRPLVLPCRVSIMIRSRQLHVSVLIPQLVWRRHAHSQLSFSLFGLQLQRFDRVAKPLLFRFQLFEFHLLNSAHRLSVRPSAPSALRRKRRFNLGVRGTQPTVIEVTFSNERLLTAFKLIEVVLYAGKE